MNFIVLWQFAGMGLFRMFFQMFYGCGLKTVLGHAHLMLIELLLVAMSSSMVMGNLDKLVVNAVYLCATANKSHFTLGIVDQSIELICLR